MYNLKINVTDLLSSKKKIRMKCGFCVFFGCCCKKNSLFYTESIDYDTVKYFQVCSWGKKDWLLKEQSH